MRDHGAGSGLWYLAEVPHDTRVDGARPLPTVPAWSGRGRQPRRKRLGDGPPEAEEGASMAPRGVPGQWQRRGSQEGSQGPMVADVWAMRVVAGRNGVPGPEVRLGQRRQRETGGLKPYVCHAPASVALATLARLRGMWWPRATGLEDGKHELGMGNDEGRRWRGWQPPRPLWSLAHFFVVRQQRRCKKTGVV